MQANLTLEQKACNADTLEHIHWVQYFLGILIQDLMQRGHRHDQSKLVSPEVEIFAEHTSKLAGLDFGTPEYDAQKKLLGDALIHHYANNSHHPEHHVHGIDDMNLMDIVEMFCDWKAASLRHHSGNLLKSIDHNAEKFEMSPQLARIFRNTAKLIDNAKG